TATPNFSLTVAPSTQTVVEGSATSYTVNIGALNGFSGVVTLSASGFPAGATANFVPATVTGSGSSTLTVSTSGTTPVGTSTVTITGTSGALTQTAGVTLAGSGTPPPPNFSLTATPGTQTGVAGGHDGEFRAGDGDGVGEFDADGDDEWNDTGGDVDGDNHGDERESDADDERDAGGDECGIDRHQVCGSGHGDGEYGSGRSGCPVELE